MVCFLYIKEEGKKSELNYIKQALVLYKVSGQNTNLAIIVIYLSNNSQKKKTLSQK